MDLDRATSSQLKRFATAFREARERQANESDTVLYLCKFFEDVLGYDSLKGEISKELAIKDRYCDIALKIEGGVRLLVEAKAASQATLADKHIEQAENYASRAGIPWVLLTNGVVWRLYHLTFAEGEGIAHDLAFEVNLLDEVDKDPKGAWAKLGILHHSAIKKGELEDYWSHRKALSPAAVVRALFRQDTLMHIRKELRREADVLLDVEDVFSAVRDVLSREALADAGDLTIGAKRRKKRKVKREDPATGEVVEVEEDSPDNEGGTPPVSPRPTVGAREPESEPETV